MAFSSSVTGSFVIGNRRLSYGTWTNAATDSGGEINTGLKMVNAFLYSITSHLGTEHVKVTKNSASAGRVTIVTSDGADGDWISIGL